MKNTLLTIRLFFMGLCLFGSYLVSFSNPDLNPVVVYSFGLLLGALTILLDMFLKGFSLRNLTVITLGIGVGTLVAFLIGSSPLFELGDPSTKFIARLCLFCTSMYLATIIALRSKDEFNLLIPYVKFVPHSVDVPVILLDTSALIDGRVATICQARFISSAIVVPKFVIDELQKLSNCEDQQRQIKGRKGVETLNKLKNMNFIDLRIQEVETDASQHMDSRLVYVAQQLKAKLLTTDYNLAKLAEFHNIEWLNLSALSKALNPEVSVGQYLDIDLVKEGKEPHQGVGYLPDGSMVVVNEAHDFIGQSVVAEVISVLPSAGGKMIFAKLHNQNIEAA